MRTHIDPCKCTFIPVRKTAHTSGVKGFSAGDTLSSAALVSVYGTRKKTPHVGFSAALQVSVLGHFGSFVGWSQGTYQEAKGTTR